MFKSLKLDYGKEALLPIIQGGMGIKVSTAPLAAAVANCGGVGVISGVGISTDELIEQIQTAKELLENKTGLLAVNIMYAVTDFYKLARTALDAKIDVIIVGAGFSRDIFVIAKESQIPVIPIVSSGKFAKLSLKLGASAVIVESGEAGGHLGTDKTLNEILPEVVETIDGKIPVIAAGGITNAEDAKKYLDMGADGVQVGSRFVMSEECDVHDNFKQVYLDAKNEDVTLIQSPVGLPGRAIKTPMVDKIFEDGGVPVKKCVKCLKKCSQSFCIMSALESARDGDIEKGLFFSGANVKKIKDILPVKDIIDNLKTAFEETTA